MIHVAFDLNARWVFAPQFFPEKLIETLAASSKTLFNPLTHRAEVAT
jgi:hypothetical protein